MTALPHPAPHGASRSHPDPGSVPLPASTEAPQAHRSTNPATSPPARPAASVGAVPEWGTEVDWASGTLRDRTRGRPPAQWRPAPQPGTLPKRPFTFFETLDGGFRLLRFAPGATFGFAMIVYTLVTLATALLVTVLIVGNLGYVGRVMSNPEAGIGLNLVLQTATATASLLVLSLVLLLSAFVAVAAEAATSSERMRLSEVWRRLRGRRLRLAGLTLAGFVAHLLMLGIAIAPGLLLLLLSPVAGVLVATLGVVAWMVATVWLFTKCSLAGAAIAVEGLGIIAAVRRSWDLTRGAFWKSTGQFVVSYFLSSQIVNLILSPILVILFFAFVLVFVLLTLDGGTGALSFLGFVLTIGMGTLIAAVTIGATALMFAYLSGVVAMVYLDRRMRREGYDLVLLRRAEEDEAQATRAADSIDVDVQLARRGVRA